MGTIIEATGVSTDPSIGSALTHAAIAAKNCIQDAGIDVQAIDLLINVGIYRDSNMVEPAMAALIQRELGLNLDFVKYRSPKAAFSLDLMNGACGLLNAVQVASAFLAAGNAEHVLIVSGDTHPSREKTPGFPYATLGAAMLLGRTENSRGFGRVYTEDSPGDDVGIEGFYDMLSSGTNGRRSITVRHDADYHRRLLELAVQSAKSTAASEGIDLRRTLLVTSRATPDFGENLAKELGLDARVAASTAAVDGDPHTSALTLGYHTAHLAGHDAEFDQVLFVAAGSGLTSASAVYRP